MAEAEQVPPDEITRLQPRVGSTPRGRLQWALDFAQADLATYTVGDWANRQREYLAFGDILITPDAVTAPWLRPFLSGRRLPATRQRSRVTGVAPLRGAPLVAAAKRSRAARTLPSRATLETAQAAWRTIIMPLLAPNGRAWGLGPFTVEIYVDRLDGQRRTRIELVADPTAPQLVLINLLGIYAHRLAVCREPACGRWFVGQRQGQRFCSRSCQSRAGVRAHRARQRSRDGSSRRRRRG